MRGGFKEMGLDERSSGNRFPGGNDSDFNGDLAWQRLSQVQDAAKEAGFLFVIVAGLVRRLELRFAAAGIRQLIWLYGLPMMMSMQHPRTDVNHEVSGQCCDGNQAVV